MSLPIVIARAAVEKQFEEGKRDRFDLFAKTLVNRKTPAGGWGVTEFVGVKLLHGLYWAAAALG